MRADLSAPGLREANAKGNAWEVCVFCPSIVSSPVSQPKIQVFSAANSTRSNSYDPFAGLEKKELGQNSEHGSASLCLLGKRAEQLT